MPGFMVDVPEESKGIGESRNKRFKSGASMVHSYVRFLNCTVRRVDVIWLNYEGVGIRYKTLDPSQWVDVNTFVGHPWTFRDSLTGDKLVVQLREVFEPPAWRNVGENGQAAEAAAAVAPQRKVFNITIPVYSLKERCLQEVRRLFPVSAIDGLDIPRTLKTELLQSPSRLSPVSLTQHNSSAHSS